MVGVNSSNVSSAYSAYASQKTKTVEADAKKSNVKQVKDATYGKTVGEPELSEKAKKYYDELKRKFGNYDFILVSKDEKENAKANASKYANSFKTVVLIDEEKIEKMATDESYRKKYEGILSGAEAKLSQMKAQMEKSGANVKGYGMQINDNGTTSFFAVLKKSSADEKARIEKKLTQKREQKKADQKKAEKEKAKERLEKNRDSGNTIDEDEEVVISADNIDDLMKKVEEYTFNSKSDTPLPSSSSRQCYLH